MEANKKVVSTIQPIKMYNGVIFYNKMYKQCMLIKTAFGNIHCDSLIY